MDVEEQGPAIAAGTLYYSQSYSLRKLASTVQAVEWLITVTINLVTINEPFCKKITLISKLRIATNALYDCKPAVRAV